VFAFTIAYVPFRLLPDIFKPFTKVWLSYLRLKSFELVNQKLLIWNWVKNTPNRSNALFGVTVSLNISVSPNVSSITDSKSPRVLKLFNKLYV